MTSRSLQTAVAPMQGLRSPFARVRRVLPFLGPAFVASVAYMDPGNFATNIQAGADYGYMLLWVLLLSNLMAILIQSLSAKLGIASGMTLPQAIRPTAPAARDLAVAGRGGGGHGHRPGRVPGRSRRHADPVRAGAVPSALITAVLSFAMLAVQQRGHSRFEMLIIAFVAVIGACFLVEVFISNPDPAGILHGMLVPHRPRAPLRGRRHGRRHGDAARRLPALRAGAARNKLLDGNSKHQHFRRELVDIALAMNGAWLINSSMVIWPQPCSSRAACRSAGSRTPRHAKAAAGGRVRPTPSASRCWPPACPLRRSARWPAR